MKPWQTQQVPRGLIQRAMEFGRALVEHYAAGGSARSRALAFGDADRDPELQGRGKVGEVAAAMYYGLDPSVAVKWDVCHADNGTDVVLPNGIRIDAKTSYPQHRLIWHVKKNHLYADKQFDVLLSVNIDEHDYSQCGFAGYATKAEFFARKIVANPSNSRLEPGTWFMHKVDLADADDLVWATQNYLPRVASPPLVPLTAREAIRTGEQFEFITGIVEAGT